MYTNTCPICGESDQVQSVDSIIAEGTEVNVNVGAVFTGGGIGGIAPAILGGISKSTLVRRLQPNREAPGDVNMFWVVVAVCVLTIISAAIMQPIWFSGISFAHNPFIWAIVVGICCVVTFLPCYVLGGIFMLVYRWTRPVARRRWNESAAYLRAAYYCHRDGVVFDGVKYGAPEDFVAYVFANSR